MKSYLKGSKLHQTLNKLSARRVAIQKQAVPVDSDFSDFKISFQDQIKHAGSINLSSSTGNVAIITKPQGFNRVPNDISDNTYNPVIHKIQAHMTKKEKARNSDSINSLQSKRASFLQIKNIWTNPSVASSIFERSFGSRPSEILNQE